MARIHRCVCRAALAIVPLFVTSTVSAQFVRITGESANIRLQPNTKATIIGTAPSGTVFTLSEVQGSWFEIYISSGESRYVHSSLAERTTSEPPLPPNKVTRQICSEIVKAEDRATTESEKRYPPTEFMKQIDYERILHDKYELPIFQKHGIAPARHSTLIGVCVEKGWP